jgi:LPXTG-site transpeptidase (sortase) family protein
VNEAPVINSNGGGTTASVSVAENGTSVTTVSASDVDAGTSLTYSISGGTDSSKFSINSSSGVLTFRSAPDYETPGDSNDDNQYQVIVRASDGSLSDTQTITVTVTNANEAPVINSNGGGSTAGVSVAENSTAVTTVSASDVDAGGSLVYSISGGTDSSKFSINSSSGALTFRSAPNYENPGDSNGDNKYQVIVRASDGSLSDTQTITVTVTNVNEAPVITSNGGGSTASISVAENGTAVTTVSASDVDAGTTLTYTISGGTDASKFSINNSNGVLVFRSAPNYEIPGDSNDDNKYQVIVRASDGSLSDTQTITVTVTNVNEAPTNISLSSSSLAENRPENTTVGSLSTTDVDNSSTFTYTLVSGTGSTDNGFFNISGSALRTSETFDYETRNSYSIRVRSTDQGGLFTEKIFTITVTNVKENSATTITSDTPDPSVTGQSYPVTVDVSPAAGGGTPTGSVNVSDGSQSCTITLPATSCTLTSTTSGAKTLTATYGGDSNWNGSSDTESHTVQKADTAVTFDSVSAEPSVYGTNYTVSVSVSAEAPGSGMPTGSVQISDGIGNDCTAALSGGSGSCSLPSSQVGTVTLNASYGGDTNFNTASQTRSHTISKAGPTVTITDVSPSPSVTGEPITVSLTVTSTAGTPTGIVIVSYGSGLPAGSCTAYLTGGVGSCTLTIATAGSKTLSAEYQGDTSFSTSTNTTAHIVQKADSAVTISSVSPETTLTGQPYTVSVTAAAVSPGAGTPTGTVSVADGEGNTCSITLSNGSGSCELAAYTIGNKTIRTDYGGDGDFNESNTSQDHPVTIANTETTITSDAPDPSGYEEQITLEASVAPVLPAGGIPEGTVQFFEDTTFLCSGVLSSGTTQCTYDDLSVGSHNLTAVYSGETSTYLGSTSAEETHLVQSIQLDDNKTSTTFTDVGEFNVEGGGAPFTFSLKASGRFCNTSNGAGNGYFGISDSTLQRKSDTPAGTYSICVESQDKDGGTIQEEFEIIINNPPSLNELSLDHKTVGVLQTVVGTLTLTDGQDPQVVSLEADGPVCTAANSSGNALFEFNGLGLERKADTPVGEYKVCVQVKDAEDEIAQWSYAITVTSPPNALTLDHQTVSTHQIDVGEFKLKDGQRPYHYTLENTGEVCNSVNGAGNDRFEIGGKILQRKADTGVGTYAICAAVEDANGLTTQQDFTITVTEPPSNLTLSNNEVNTVEEIVGTLQTTAGQYLYEYSLEDNGDVCTLVNGADNDLFEVEGNALKRKANTSAGFYAVCLQTRDANGEVFQKAFSVTVSYEPASSELWSIALTSDMIVDGEGPGTLAGSMISTLHGTTFTLVDTDLFPLAANFNISPDGKLTLKTTANYALHQYYPLRLAGTSPDGETKTLDVVIQVMKNGTSAGAQAVPDEASVFVTKQIRIDVLSNDILSEGATEWVEHQIVRYPVLGEAEIGSIIYSASKILTGMDTLTYRACDDLGFCVTGEVEIAIESISGIPATGFPQGINSRLPVQPEEQVYSAENGLSIEIPKLSIDTPILGIPLEEGSWDLTWLGNQVGWLNGSAYPTWDGNAILTGHLVNAWGRPGVFHDLADLMWGDRVLIQMDGQTYTFEVREILENVAADDVETLTVHREEPWLSLVTCQDYDEESGTYSGRLIVRAVLVKVE